MVALLQPCHLANYPADGGRPVWLFPGYLQASDKFGYAGVLQVLQGMQGKAFLQAVVLLFWRSRYTHSS